MVLKVLNFSSTIPVISIQLADTGQMAGRVTPAQAQLLGRGPNMPAVMCTCGATPDGVDYDDLAVRLRVRGSSSARLYAKKSFALRTLDQSANLSTAEDNKVGLLGFPREHNWVLHGPENDRTLGMRNWLAYNMGRQMGRYASRTRYFELFLNTEPNTPLSMNHYWGVYMLQEPVTRDKHRVPIAKYDPAVDPSGGFMFAYENDNIDIGSDPVFIQRLTQLVMVVDYPNNADQQTVAWLSRWMNAFEAALLARGTANMTGLLDVPAAADYFLATEVTKNPDGYRGSVKLHKDRAGPLVIGPLWDYNEAFGMCCGFPIEGFQQLGSSNGTSGGSAISAAGWRFNVCQDRGRCKVDPLDGISQWYRRLWQDPLFRNYTAARWQQLRAPGGNLTNEWFAGQIAELKQLLHEPASRNYQRWSNALNRPAYGRAYPTWQAMFDSETSQLQQWTIARLRWMDAALAAQANVTAPADAYLGIGYVQPEPPVAGGANADDDQVQEHAKAAANGVNAAHTAAVAAAAGVDAGVAAAGTAPAPQVVAVSGQLGKR
ncbi:coth protein-domain-containing protein [Scenedesmus sp. NREL 46B-D3]|nr:coth protein-domain-containing protein [Scenedesmus sp. NREL 46B-D3]